ncbi:hypothetical protein [Paludisphaera sp.]|uniref:hypothetical protein n=1 Tax=Paludisphaera sp. TaxID=2017432 RepID=UPI00301C0C41
MATDRRWIGAEVATVALVAACLAGTLNLVISVHRKALQPPKVASVVPPAPPEPAPTPEPEPEPAPVQVVEQPRPAPSPPPEPAEDPTPKVLAGIAEATAAERAEADRLDREAAGLEQGSKVAAAGAESWRRREMLVKQQLAALDDKARETAREVDAHAARRDVLERERDALKAAVAAAPGEGSYAVLPYQGENGTWRRPIVIECTAGQVTMRPNGPSFTMLELSGLANPRSSPVVVAIARELLKVQNSGSPDGSPVTPYFVFLVRPDGVRSYYELRARLEPLGIAFGYELVDADMEVHVPDYDNLAAWDGTPTLDAPPSGLAGGGPDGRGAGGGAGSLAGGGLAWPGAGGGGTGTGSRPRLDSGAFDLARGRGAGEGAGPGGDGAGDGPDAFVWPSRRSGAGRGGALEGLDDAESVEPGADEPGTRGAMAGGEPSSRPDVNRGGRPGGGIKPPARDAGRPDFARRGEGTGLDRPGAGRNATASRDAAEPGGGLMWGDSAPPGVSPSVVRGYRGGRLANAGAAETPSTGPSSEAAGEPPRELSLGDAIGDALEASGSGMKPSVGASGSGMSPPAGASGSEMTPPPGLLGSGMKPPEGALGSGMKPPAIAPGVAGGLARLALGMGASGGGQPGPGLMLGGAAEPAKGGGGSGGSASDGGEAGMGPLIPDPDGERPKNVSVPFEIVVACGRDGVTIQPGSRRITTHALKHRRDEELLVRNLEAEARRRATLDPALRPRPRVKFVVQEDGAANFWEARRQLLFSGLDWPMSLQVAGAQNPRLLDEGGIW